MFIKLSAFKLFLLLVVASFAVQALPKIQLIEDAIEGEPRVIFIARDLTGHLKASKCEEGCPEIKITITPETKAYVARKPVSLKSMAKKSSKPNLIFFDIKTKVATRLYWPAK